MMTNTQPEVRLIDILNKQDNEGRTFLYRAIKDHAKDVIGNRGMLNWLVISEIKNKGFEEFANVLLTHVESGNFIKFLQCLVDEGIDINGKYKPLGGGVPLHLMVERAPNKGISLDIIKFWLEKAQANVNVSDDKGITPLHHVAKLNNIEVTKILLEAGANVGGLSSYYSYTFLGFISIPFHPNAQILSLLINYGGIIDNQQVFDSYVKNIEEIRQASDLLIQNKSLHSVIELLKASLSYQFRETVDMKKFFAHLESYAQDIETTSWTSKISSAKLLEDIEKYENQVHELKCETAVELFNTIKTKLQENIIPRSSSISDESDWVITDVQSEYQEPKLKITGEDHNLSESV